MAGVNMIALLAAAADVGSLGGLVLPNFVGGGCGYLVGPVTQGYIVMHYRNVYIAAFWAGDAMGGALAALLAIVQRPELGAQGRRFGPGTFYLVVLPLIPLS